MDELLRGLVEEQEEHFVALVAENSPAWIVGYFAIVSLGLSCAEMHGEIVLAVDIANTPKRAYRQIIPALRQALAELSRSKDPGGVDAEPKSGQP